MKNWKNIFIASAVVALLYLVICGLGAGASGDEYFHVNHSEDVFNYYKTLGEDKTAATVTDKNNLPFYSQFPDTFIQFIIKTLSAQELLHF